jgi:hypothetical protein
VLELDPDPAELNPYPDYRSWKFSINVQEQVALADPNIVGRFGRFRQSCIAVVFVPNGSCSLIGDLPATPLPLLWRTVNYCLWYSRGCPGRGVNRRLYHRWSRNEWVRDDWWSRSRRGCGWSHNHARCRDCKWSNHLGSSRWFRCRSYHREFFERLRSVNC